MGTPLYNIDVFDRITKHQTRFLYFTDKDRPLIERDERYRVIAIEKLKITLEDYKDELVAFYPYGVNEG